MVKPLVTAPPHPGIYETDFSPEAAFSSAVTEVFRIEAPDVQRAAKVGEAWGYLINSMGKRLPELKSLSGLSLNYEQTQFLGIIGWDSLKVGDNAELDALLTLTASRDSASRRSDLSGKERTRNFGRRNILRGFI